MTGIPANLYQRLVNALLQCEAFDSNQQIKSRFIDSRINVWRNGLPEVENRTERVALIINFLTDKFNNSQENALVLFLRVLSDQLHPSDTRHQALTQLANELEKMGGHSEPYSQEAQMIQNDAVSFNYRMGLQLLKNKVIGSQLDEETKLDLLTLEARLLANLNDEQRFGPSETLSSERARILRELNRLSLQLNVDFIALCQGQPATYSEIHPEVEGISETLLQSLYKTGRELERAGYKREAAAKYWQVWRSAPEYQDVTSRLAVLERVQREFFVGRQKELVSLMTLFERSMLGATSIALISGEAGIGKTTLVNEFLAQVQAKYDHPLYAIGSCNAQFGIGESYLPFKEVVLLLCGEVENQLALGNISITNARRLYKASPITTQAILDLGPNLRNVFAIPSLISHKGVPQDNRKQQTLAVSLQMASPLTAFSDNARIALTIEYSMILQRIADNFPLIIFLDDMQWSDANSIDLLYYLATKLRNARIMLIVAFRSSEIEASKLPLKTCISELAIRLPEILKIDMDQIDKSFVQMYISKKYSSNQFPASFAAYMQMHTGSNALFVSELFQYLEEANKLIQNEQGVWQLQGELDFKQLPSKVEHVIERRISSLETDLRKMLDAASVEGEEFTAQVIAELRGVDEKRLLEQLSGELERKWHLIANSRSVSYQDKRLYMYRFKHAIIRMYIYEQLTPVERELLHRDVALFLETFHRDRLNSVSSILAEHFHQANMPEREAKYRLLAAYESIRVGARETAIYHLDGLEILLEGKELASVDRSNWAKQLYGMRGTLYALVPLSDKALSDLRKLERIARIDQDTCAIAQALCGQAILDHSLGNFRASLEFAAQAGELISNETCKAVLADCRLTQSKTHKDLAEYNETIKLAILAKELYEELNNSYGILDASSQIAYGYYAQGKYAAAEEILLSNLRLSRENSNIQAEQQACFYLGFLNWRLGLHLKAKQFFSIALELARQMDDEREQAYCLNDLGFVETSLENYAEAESVLKDALQMFEQLGDKKGQCWALGNLGDAFVKAGQLNRGIEFLKKNFSFAQEIELRSDVAESSRRLGLAYLELSNLSESFKYAQLALQEAQEIGRKDFVGMIYRVLGEISASAQFTPGVQLANIQDPEHYFSQSLEIVREVGSLSEQAQTLRAWGNYLKKLPEIHNHNKGEHLIQEANALQSG